MARPCVLSSAGDLPELGAAKLPADLGPPPPSLTVTTTTTMETSENTGSRRNSGLDFSDKNENHTGTENNPGVHTLKLPSVEVTSQRNYPVQGKPFGEQSAALQECRLSAIRINTSGLESTGPSM